MTKRVFPNDEIIRILVEEEDGKKALAQFMTIGVDRGHGKLTDTKRHKLSKEETDARARKDRMCKIKKAVLQKNEEKLRNPLYASELQAICDELDRDSSDFKTLSHFMSMSLFDQEKEARYMKLDNAEALKAFQAIKPSKAFLYEFLDPNISKLANSAQDKVNALKRESAQCYTKAQVEKWIRNAIRVILELPSKLEALKENASSTLSDWERVIHTAVAALLLVTGRRATEVIKTLTLTPIEHRPYQVRAEGIAKGQDCTDLTIPLLMKSEHVIKALSIVQGTVYNGQKV